MSDRPMFKRLDEILLEANDQIDAILGGQDNPDQAEELAKEIQEKAAELFRGCCVRRYKLLRWAGRE